MQFVRFLFILVFERIILIIGGDIMKNFLFSGLGYIVLIAIIIVSICLPKQDEVKEVN